MPPHARIDAGHPLLARRSIRRFLDRPLPDGLLEHLLDVARRAPSGANLQPGEFIRVVGATRARLGAALRDAHRDGRQESEDYRYFPEPMPHALRRRQVAAAQALYGALGIAREDRAARARHFERNFDFFDAPVALLVTIDARLGAGGYMDLGMLLHALMLAASAAGLGSCAIGALAHYPRLIRAQLGLPESRHLVCGLALGYADPDAPDNACRTTRVPVGEFFTTLGGEE
ncbi:nitroreductase [Robbsia sp. Bb-Pol-6]|uniref:Nitroreductase n=1 Tax=Robbsia betulipollinis TaxID=2981849 RepID=A0ABT3ZKH2_9BURK|nr:nitroreductase [Robbsia betulipollinis]